MNTLVIYDKASGRVYSLFAGETELPTDLSAKFVTAPENYSGVYVDTTTDTIFFINEDNDQLASIGDDLSLQL